MTVREKLEELLVNHGLWPEEANIVLQTCEEASENEAMRERWGDEVTGYSCQLLAVLWMLVRRQAVDWIDANKPKHFARAALAAAREAAGGE